MALKESSAALILYENLPPDVRRDWGPRKVRRITGDIMAAEKIREAFQGMWAIEKRALTWKKKEGFCAGELACMNRPEGSAITCSTCLGKQRKGSSRSNRRSAYGQWRAVQRAVEKAERE